MLALPGPAASSAQVAGELTESIAATRITPRDGCSAQAPSSDEIVVCGQRDRSEQYRVPNILRERPPGRAGTSWGAQVREFEEDLRNGDTMSGLGGAQRHYRQWIREWKAERDQIARDKAEQNRLVDASK
jgi:hypothetical protein